MMAVNGTANGHSAATLSGAVEAVNPKGIRLGGRWFNWSQYGPALPRPGKGQRVEVQVKGDFISALDLLDGAPDAHHSPAAGRETAIIRQTCLKAAAAFCAARPELKWADLLALAERMEAWVRREEA